MKSKISKLAVAALFSLAAVSANAAVIIDTGARTDSSASIASQYDEMMGIFYQSSLGYRVSFTDSYNITDISSYFNSGDSIGVLMSLYSDNSGTPNTQLYSQSFSFSDPYTDTWAGLSGINWNVTAGNYWLTYETFYGQADLYGSSTSFPSVYMNGFEPVWQSNGSRGLSLVITGTSVNPVPEADTSAMLLMGVGVMGFMARRRKNAQA
jgi:hypothetical protein